MLKITALAVGFWLTACASPQMKISPPLYNYRADMQLTVDEKTFDGMAVTKLGEKNIGIVSKAPLNYLQINSCARDFVLQNVDQGWFGGVGKSYTYAFTPSKYESDFPCPLYVQAVGANGISAWGYIFWKTDETLPAQFDCNGVRWKFSGASVCQTKTGIRQEIFFDRPVSHAESELCEITPDKKTPNAFVLSNKSNGFCYVTFTDGKDWHRTVLLGYTQVIVRD